MSDENITPRKLTLKKFERLNSKISINDIVSNGELSKAYPVFISYTTSTSDYPEVKALFSVSKRKQKLAVNRNRIKRKLKEAYRSNKLSLYDFSQKNNITLNLMVIQVIGDDMPYATIEKKMKKALAKVVEKESKKLK